MLIPAQLKIGGHLVTVIRKPLADKRGEYDPCALTMTLDNSLPASIAGATLLHEALHCMNSELEHCLLDSLAEQLYAFLSDNGLLALDNVKQVE